MKGAAKLSTDSQMMRDVGGLFRELRRTSAKVHRSLKVEDTDDLNKLISFEELIGPTPEVINGV